MKSQIKHCCLCSLRAAAFWLLASQISLGQGDDRLVGVWVGEGFTQTVELIFRSDGRYRAASTTRGSEFGPIIDHGRYEVVGQSLRMISYQYFQKPGAEVYEFQLDGDSLSLDGGPDLSVTNLSLKYELTPGSKADVLAREQASHDLVRRWTRHNLFAGDEEWTFRPGGYYSIKTTSENVDLVQFQRGRYEQTGTQLTLKPYSLAASNYEVDIFGTTLTLVSTNGWSGQFTDYVEVPRSAAEVAAKAAEAQAFLSNFNWQAGLWQIQDRGNAIDLLLRPDGFYTATNAIKNVYRVWRGRYTLQADEIHLAPFIGQERWVLDDANFGMAERTYTLDYYDGELQIIDLNVAFTQSVRLAHQSAGSHTAVVELARQAQAERDRDGWSIGIWEAQAPAAWMEFTFRPDNRDIAKSGAAGVPSNVERGQYVVAPGKITLAPYAGNGPARGFDLDLYDGNLVLIGDADQLVIVRKIVGSEIDVTEKTRDPVALKGERGSILGRWTANRPKEAVELVFRQDGQFRLKRCTNNTTSYDYGLYTVDMANHRLVYDSRFLATQTQQLDFYGDTITIYGGLTNNIPCTYTVNLGSVDAAIAASLAADAAEAPVDAQWLARVPIALKDQNLMPTPNPEFPDPNSDQVFPAPTVFTTYQFYRRLIPCFVPGLVNGQLTPLAVVDTEEWHFFSTGRVLFRLRFNHADWSEVIQDVTDFWGAYQIGPRPTESDVLHCYANNGLPIKTDLGEQENLTLENGRRTLFWGKEVYFLGDWANEQKPIPCELASNSDPTLINTGLSLSTTINPDPVEAQGPRFLDLTGPVSGSLTLGGTTEITRSLVLERTVNLARPIQWEPLRTNSLLAGRFSFTITGATNATAFFRLRSP